MVVVRSWPPRVRIEQVRMQAGSYSLSEQLTARIEAELACPVTPSNDSIRSSASARAAQVIVAEIGLDIESVPPRSPPCIGPVGARYWRAGG
jgi:hypothetical protein